MVFSSVPLYLDPPNWQQTHQYPNNETPNPHQLQLPPQLGGGGSQPPQIKPPGSTSERARMAKIPAPDGPLRCPRPGCESTNTKFCYYNNYNLSQPRHFCKACRRYWTRGGALRNVPVGGACRRNKRRKKSPGPKLAEPHRHQAPQPDHHLHRMLPPVGPAPSSAPPYSFMASLQGMTSLGMGMTSYGGNNNNNNSNIINYSQLGYGVAAQQLSLFAGPSSSSVASMYPFQMSEGGEETASYRGGAGQFWGAHINNNNNSSPAAGSSGGGLWTDLSGSHMQ